MAMDLTPKRILVLSDNSGLGRAIELNLNRHLEVVRLAPNPLGQRGGQAEVGHLDLVVVAMSSPAGEPGVALDRAALTGRIRQVPMLIISNKPFHSGPEDRIVHLDFPFEMDELYTKVIEMLREEISTSSEGSLRVLEGLLCNTLVGQPVREVDWP